MARIAGVNVPLNKRAEIGLTYVYGIGRATSNKLLAEAGVNPDTSSCATSSTATSRSRATCAASAPRTSSA